MPLRIRSQLPLRLGQPEVDTRRWHLSCLARRRRHMARHRSRWESLEMSHVFAITREYADCCCGRTKRLSRTLRTCCFISPLRHFLCQYPRPSRLLVTIKPDCNQISVKISMGFHSCARTSSSTQSKHVDSRMEKEKSSKPSCVKLVSCYPV